MCLSRLSGDRDTIRPLTGWLLLKRFDAFVSDFKSFWCLHHKLSADSEYNRLAWMALSNSWLTSRTCWKLANADWCSETGDFVESQISYPKTRTIGWKNSVLPSLIGSGIRTCNQRAAQQDYRRSALTRQVGSRRMLQMALKRRVPTWNVVSVYGEAYS